MGLAKIMSEAVTVTSWMMMTAVVSEESLARDTDTHRHRHTASCMLTFSTSQDRKLKRNKTEEENTRIIFVCMVVSDRYLMFYAQSTAKGKIRAKQNVFLPQVKF